MLRIHVSASAAQARAYYTQSLARADYYLRDLGQERLGDWQGQGAARLGLYGPVTPEAFGALVDNRHPGTGAMLTPRQAGDRRPGFDCTFAAPKSVALAYAFATPQRREAILAAFQGAVRATMHEMEQAAQTRVRIGGADADRVTGNLLWGEFVHLSARPVAGRADVDLHAHCYVLNGTYDAVEGRWKAVQPHGFMRDAPYYEAAFHARLAHAMRALGFGVARQGRFWDVHGLPRSVIEKSSRRTQEIAARAAALGLTDARAKGALGAKTRAHKAPNTDYATLVAQTWAHLDPQEQQAVRQVLDRAEHGIEPPGDAGRQFGHAVTVDDAVTHAVLACFERQSVVSEA
jgi:conjugative relaxase-like TrwC/TraI family protein